MFEPDAKSVLLVLQRDMIIIQKQNEFITSLHNSGRFWKVKGLFQFFSIHATFFKSVFFAQQDESCAE